MKAIDKSDLQEERILEKIRSMFLVHEQFCDYATALQVSVENTAIILQGHLPNAALKQQLVPAIRRAGVLWRISNCVEVDG